jgi:hypothetical protein
MTVTQHASLIRDKFQRWNVYRYYSPLSLLGRISLVFLSNH